MAAMRNFFSTSSLMSKSSKQPFGVQRAKRGGNAGIGIAGLDSNVGAERGVDRHLHNQSDRLTFHFHRMGNGPTLLR